MNLANKLFELSQHLKDETAIIHEGQALSYFQLWKKVDILGNAFYKIGIREGDRVAIILPNSLELIVTYFALQKINAIVVPVEPIYNARSYKEMLDECPPKALITNSFLALNSLLFEKSLIHKKLFITVDHNPWLKENFPKMFTYDDLYKFTLKSVPLREFSSEDTALIFHTYRDFGYPLGAEITSKNLFHGVVALENIAKDAKTFLAVLPFSHIFGFLSTILVPLSRGIRLVIPKSQSAEDVFRAIKVNKVDFMIGVPTLYLYLINSFIKEKHNLSSLKYAISGGNFLNTTTHLTIEKKLGIKIYQGYGLSEALIVSCNPSSKNVPGSLGIPGPGIQVKIVDKNFKELDKGKKGEIAISGPTVMKGYHKRAHSTHDVLREGWLLTGDLGHIDKNGYLYFDGLKKRIAKISGHNVDLTEVERVLESYYRIKKVKAYARSDFIWGQKIGIDVYPKMKISKEEILYFCQQNFCIFQIPKIIKIKK